MVMMLASKSLMSRLTCACTRERPGQVPWCLGGGKDGVDALSCQAELHVGWKSVGMTKDKIESPACSDAWRRQWPEQKTGQKWGNGKNERRSHKKTTKKRTHPVTEQASGERR